MRQPCSASRVAQFMLASPSSAKQVSTPSCRNDSGQDLVNLLAAHDAASWLEHFPAKWIPVRVAKMRPNKGLEPRSDSIGTEKALSAPASIRRARRGNDDLFFERGQRPAEPPPHVEQVIELGVASGDRARIAADLARTFRWAQRRASRATVSGSFVSICMERPFPASGRNHPIA